MHSVSCRVFADHSLFSCGGCSQYESIKTYSATTTIKTATTSTTTLTMSTKKKTWKVFWDLQCPYARKNWERLDSIKKRFESEYDITVHLTSLIHHPHAFLGQCGASLVETYKGRDAFLRFVDACYENQEKYSSDVLVDPRRSDVIAVFAEIADSAGLLDTHTEGLTKEKFVKEIDDKEKAFKPAYSEYKRALSYGVHGTPKNVIEEKLILDTESLWGPDEWAEKLLTCR
jgi:protein-disulfide isomerase